MYIAPGRARQHMGNKILMTTERPFLFAHILQVSKCSLQNLILNTFLMILYMYIAPGQGQTTPWGQTFDVNKKPLSFCPFVAGFKKIALKSDIIYIFFMFHHMHIAPGRGRQSIGDKILLTTERPFLFAHMLQVSKCSLRNLILYTFLMILYMYIAPGQGQKTPWGQTFDVNRKPLSLRPFIASFKQTSFNSDFIHIF